MFTLSIEPKLVEILAISFPWTVFFSVRKLLHYSLPDCVAFESYHLSYLPFNIFFEQLESL